MTFDPLAQTPKSLISTFIPNPYFSYSLTYLGSFCLITWSHKNIFIWSHPKNRSMPILATISLASSGIHLILLGSTFISSPSAAFLNFSLSQKYLNLGEFTKLSSYMNSLESTTLSSSTSCSGMTLGTKALFVSSSCSGASSSLKKSLGGEGGGTLGSSILGISTKYEIFIFALSTLLISPINGFLSLAADLEDPGWPSSVIATPFLENMEILTIGCSWKISPLFLAFFLRMSF